MRTYSASTVSNPYQQAIDQYTGGLDDNAAPPSSFLEADQGAFHPSMMSVADPITSRFFGGPSNAGAIAANPRMNANPQMQALHDAIAQYYQS